MLLAGDIPNLGHVDRRFVFFWHGADFIRVKYRYFGERPPHSVRPAVSAAWDVGAEGVEHNRFPVRPVAALPLPGPAIGYFSFAFIAKMQ